MVQMETSTLFKWGSLAGVRFPASSEAKELVGNLQYSASSTAESRAQW